MLAVQRAKLRFGLLASEGEAQIGERERAASARAGRQFRPRLCQAQMRPPAAAAAPRLRTRERPRYEQKIEETKGGSHQTRARARISRALASTSISSTICAVRSVAPSGSSEPSARRISAIILLHARARRLDRSATRSSAAAMLCRAAFQADQLRHRFPLKNDVRHRVKAESASTPKAGATRARVERIRHRKWRRAACRRWRLRGWRCRFSRSQHPRRRGGRSRNRSRSRSRAEDAARLALRAPAERPR